MKMGHLTPKVKNVEAPVKVYYWVDVRYAPLYSNVYRIIVWTGIATWCEYYAR